MAVVWSSFGVVAIRYVLPVLWMTSCFFYNGPYSGMNFVTKDRFSLNLLFTVKSGRIKFNLLLLNGIILANYFEITRKESTRGTEKFDD